MRQNSEDTIISTETPSESVREVTSVEKFESYDIKPEAFDARASHAFLSEEAWGG